MQGPSALEGKALLQEGANAPVLHSTSTPKGFRFFFGVRVVWPGPERTGRLAAQGILPLRQRTVPFMLELVAMGTVAWFGYRRTADLISRRFRFVDSLLDPRAPLLLGLLGSLLAAPLVWLLPGIGAPTALVAGLSVAAGVALGSRRFARP